MLYGHSVIYDFSDYELSTLKRVVELLEELEELGFPQDQDLMQELKSEIDFKENEDEPIEDDI